MEELLRIDDCEETRAGLNAFFRALPVAYWSCGADLRVRACGGGGWQRLGLMPSEIRGVSVGELFRGTEHSDAAVALHRRGLAGERGELLAAWGRGWWRFQVAPVVTDGEVTAVAVVATDCTAEVDRQQELEDACWQHRLMIDQVAAYLVHLDHLERITLCNRQFAAWLGATPAELEMATLRQTMGMQNYEPLEKAIDRAACGQEAWLTVAYEIDGEERWFETTLTPDASQPGRQSRRGFVLLMREVTQRVLADRRQREGLERLNRQMRLESLGMMAAGVAHDFNNMLAEIGGSATLGMVALSPDDPSYATLAQIRLATARASDLCKQLMLYSGDGELTLVPVAIGQILKKCVADSRSLMADGVVWEVSIPEKLPMVSGNIVELRRMFVNLIRNAAEAIGERGRFRVAAAVRWCNATELAESVGSDRALEGDYVVVELADDGCGMSEAVLGRLLEPFFTTKDGGHGLGIAAVLGAVRSHGGALRVESSEGVGTTFWIYLPVEPN